MSEQALDELLAPPFEEDGVHSALKIWPPGRTKNEAKAALARGDEERARRIILGAGHGRIQTAAEALSLEDIKHLVPSRRDIGRLRAECVPILTAAARSFAALRRIVGSSRALNRVRREIWKLSFGDNLSHTHALREILTDHDVLIVGETGTGKESAAAAIHAGTLGPAGGAEAPFATLNAAAVPNTLIESELFGYEKGAFTGASSSRLGRIRAAHGGVFFLDEVGDLHGVAQAKLLRVMETDQVQPLGSDRTVQARVRYVSATHQDLDSLVESGSFRRDLFQRIAGAVVHIPPLRERPEDLPLIAAHFLQRYGASDEQQQGIRTYFERPSVQGYSWPGNVREVQNVLRSLLLGLEPRLDSAGDDTTVIPAHPLPPLHVLKGTAPLDDVTAWYCKRVLHLAEGNYSEAARRLDVDRSTVKRHAG